MSLSFSTDDQARVPVAGIVHGLVRHAGAHRPVADDADNVAVVAGQSQPLPLVLVRRRVTRIPQVARHRHPEPG